MVAAVSGFPSVQMICESIHGTVGVEGDTTDWFGVAVQQFSPRFPSFTGFCVANKSVSVISGQEESRGISGESPSCCGSAHSTDEQCQLLPIPIFP